MKAYWGVEDIYAFLTSALYGDEWPASRSGCFTPRERVPGTHWVGGWTRWWRETFPASAGTLTLDHPARSPPLYHWAIPKSPWCPFYMRVGGPRSRSGLCCEEKKISCRQSNPGRPICSLVTIWHMTHKEIRWKLWTECAWLRMGTTDGLLWKR
jgi:hypothetical protein